jgi:hypothetical protein
VRTLALLAATAAALSLIASKSAPAMPVASFGKIQATGTPSVEKVQYRPYRYRSYYYWPYYPYYYRPYTYYGHCLGCGWPFGW